MIINNSIRILILTLISLIVFNTSYAQSDWEFNTSLYGWFAGIDGTVGLVDKEKQIDATPGDLLNNLRIYYGRQF